MTQTQTQIQTQTETLEPKQPQPNFWGPLMAEVEGHPALHHRFLQRFAEEPLSLKQLRAFAVQHYLYSRLFARNLAAVIANVPDETARNLLVLNMYEEIGEPNRIYDRLHYLLIKEKLVPGPILGVALEAVARQSNEADLASFLVDQELVSRKAVDDLLQTHRLRAADATHPALFRRFLRALGHDVPSLRRARPLPETTAFIAEFESLCRKSSWLEGLGALGPGTECVVTTIYSYLLRGIEASKLVSPRDYIFWTVHVQCDDQHGANILSSLEPHATSSRRAMDTIRRGARRILDARRRWFDGLERHVFGS
jgi:pyrroloquinoline quinone (PQQ) biosynthesis protein C